MQTNSPNQHCNKYVEYGEENIDVEIGATQGFFASCVGDLSLTRTQLTTFVLFDKQKMPILSQVPGK